MNLPIRARLTAWYALFIGAILVGLGAFLVLSLRSDLYSRINRELRSSSGAIRQNYLDDGIPGFRVLSSATLRRSGSQAQVLDARGDVIVSYGGEVALDPMVPADRLRSAAAGRSQLFEFGLGDTAQPFRVLVTPVQVRHRRQLVVVAEPLQGANEAVRKILILLLIAIPIVLGAASIGGWLLVRNALLPVVRMRKKAERIGIDELHERLVAPNERDEIGQLAATLNAMLDRLESGVIARRRLIADASHELRSPLAAMRAELDVSLRDADRSPSELAVLRSVREDVDRLSRTVENLLTLARADDGRLELMPGEVDLDEVARAAASPLLALAAAKDVKVSVIGGGPAIALADRARLHQAITNLIDNAVKFTPAGGEVTVSTWTRGREVGITVADNGVGIPADARDHVFDRFYRVDSSRSRESGGSGLGLAICREIAVAHGGRIWVQSEEDHGSAFSIALPSVAVPSASEGTPQTPVEA